jgi:hypothetical protein
MIADAAMQAGVDPSLALELAMQESSLNQAARGAAGEIGIFQIEPSTAPGVNLADLQTNIATGVGLLAMLLARYGDTAKALAAYNCGPTCVDRAISRGGADNWFSFVPGSTQNYVNDILMNTASAPSIAPAPAVVDAATAALDTVDATASSVDQLAAAAGGNNWGSPGTIVILIGVGLIGFLVVRDVLAEA